MTFDDQMPLSLAYEEETPTPDRSPPFIGVGSIGDGWSTTRTDHLTRRWGEGATGQQIADELGGVSRSAVLARVAKLGLNRGRGRQAGRPKLSRAQAEESARAYAEKMGARGTRKAYASLGDDATFSRFVRIPGFVPKPGPKQLAFDARHPAFMEGRSIFSEKGVKRLDQVTNLLVSGHSNVKIGRDVRRGRFQGYWIYTLTLPERSTCPRSCAHWVSCYGNHMPYAKRIGVTPENRFEFEQRLGVELKQLLNVRGREGVLIRLHALGDFFDSDYVRFWLYQLAQHPNLAVYGYTARRPDDPIGREIADGKAVFGRRFAIRWSDGGLERDSTVSILTEAERPADAFVCPEQTGRSDGCGKCGACWTGDKNVAFITH